MRKLGAALQALDVNEIKAMSKDAFEGIVDKLGTIKWDKEQLTALVNKAKEKWGDG